jgi:hypothetical protein
MEKAAAFALAGIFAGAMLAPGAPALAGGKSPYGATVKEAHRSYKEEKKQCKNLKREAKKDCKTQAKLRRDDWVAEAKSLRGQGKKAPVAPTGTPEGTAPYLK